MNGTAGYWEVPRSMARNLRDLCRLDWLGIPIGLSFGVKFNCNAGSNLKSFR